MFLEGGESSSEGAEGWDHFAFVVHEKGGERESLTLPSRQVLHLGWTGIT